MHGNVARTQNEELFSKFAGKQHAMPKGHKKQGPSHHVIAIELAGGGRTNNVRRAATEIPWLNSTSAAPKSVVLQEWLETAE